MHAILEKLETVTHDGKAHLYLRTICCFNNGILALELSGERRQSGYQFSILHAFGASKMAFSQRKAIKMPRKGLRLVFCE